MKLVTIVGMMPHLDEVVQVCGESGLFHPEDALTFFSDTKGFSAVREENPYTEPLTQLKAAIQQAGGQPERTWPADLSESDLLLYIQHFRERTAKAAEQITALSQQRETLARDIEQFEHLKGLNVELSSLLACQNIKVRFGRLPAESYEKLDLYSDNPYVLFFPAGKEKNYYWGMYFAPLEFVEDVDRIFSGLYFERIHIPTASGTVEETLDRLYAEREKTVQALEEARTQQQTDWEQEKKACLSVYTAIHRKEYLFGLRRYAARYHEEFIMTGWVPAPDQKRFETLLRPPPLKRRMPIPGTPRRSS